MSMSSKKPVMVSSSFSGPAAAGELAFGDTGELAVGDTGDSQHQSMESTCTETVTDQVGDAHLLSGKPAHWPLLLLPRTRNFTVRVLYKF